MSRLSDKLRFRIMVAAFFLRDTIRPRRIILDEVNIENGFHVLDFGCGAGSYIAETASRIGETGKIYALDKNPLAIQRARKIAKDRKIPNFDAINSDCETGLTGSSVDVVLFYDILHMIDDLPGVLKEIHRILKPSGILSVSDHHLEKQEIERKISATSLFKLKRMRNHTIEFYPIR